MSSQLLFALAIASAAAMGFAIQRGATCMVYAVDELLVTRRATRLLAMLEAALWVGLALVAVRGLHDGMAVPPGYEIGAWTFVGGALLGLGAVVNGACVFGSVARLGSGEWAYLATPLGFWLGCATLAPLFGDPHPLRVAEAAPAPALAVAAGLAVLAVLPWRAWRVTRRHVEGHGAWNPHAATLAIGLAFLVSLLAAGAWAWTDLVADLARGMLQGSGTRAALALALLAGAVGGGWHAGKLRAVAPAPRAIARCIAGGALMAWGSLLVPGSNDGLLLVGLPLFRPYAWTALATMVSTVLGLLVLQRRWLAAPGAPA